MKESWLLYDYLQRWWRLLLVCCSLGILGAYLLVEPTVYAKNYTATATLALSDHMWVPELPTLFVNSNPPQALVTIESGPTPTKEEAKAIINTKFSQVSEYSGIPVEWREIVIREYSLGTWAWWKGTTMGGFIGLLAAIGIIYAWTDVHAYRKRDQAAQSQY